MSHIGVGDLVILMPEVERRRAHRLYLPSTTLAVQSLGL